MIITKYLKKCVKEKIPVSFSKYGDGEYYCANGYIGRNCDNDNYTIKKKIALVDSFIYMTNEAENAYVGLWHDINFKKFWDSLSTKPIKWANYHTLIFDKNYDEDKAELIHEIKNSTHYIKIIVCNELLVKSKLLFDADHIIYVPFNNWFDNHFQFFLNNIKDTIKKDSRPPLLITCCGMSAKIFIYELHKLFPNGIYLDYGSALDIICTKRDSRGFSHNYEYVYNLLKFLLPQDWEDEKYNYIYTEAKKKLGLHVK